MESLQKRVSFAIGDFAVNNLLDHVSNIVWAKQVFKKVPWHIVENLVTESKFLTKARFMPYDPREDDEYSK